MGRRWRKNAARTEDACGYAAAYTAVQEGDAWTFTAETHSPKWETMNWKGTIKGERVFSRTLEP